MEKELIWVILFVFIDVLGFSLILPLLPYYAEEFSASPSLIGLLLTANAFFQMISAPVLGKLSDTYGRRPLLIICILGTVVSFYLLGAATSISQLFFSRILDGLLGGNISLAQAYISDVTTHGERTKALGFVGAAFGFGFIIGPAIGGSLSVYGYRFPAYVACMISLVNLLGVVFFLPESLTAEKRGKSDHTALSHFPLVMLFNSLRTPVLGPLLVLRFFYGFTFTIFETCFGFYNMQRLGLDARRSSYLLCYVGLVFSLVQGGGLKASLKRSSEGKVILYSCIILSVSLIFWSSSFTTPGILGSLFPVSLASGFLNTLINSEITKQVEQSELGGTLGLSASIGSFTRVIAPISSGYLIDHFGVWSPGVSGALLMGLMTLFVYYNNIHLLNSNHLIKIPDTSDKKK